MTETTEPTNPTAVAATYAVPTLAAVTGAYASWQAGKITERMFMGTATQALHVARVSVSFFVNVALAAARPDVRPVGRGADDYSDRDKASLKTVTEDPAQAEARLERFVRSTLTQYGRDEYLDLASEYGATGWVWRTEMANCDYCADRDGQEFGLDVEFRDHPNCNCYPEAIFDAGFSNLAHVESESEND